MPILDSFVIYKNIHFPYLYSCKELTSWNLQRKGKKHTMTFAQITFSPKVTIKSRNLRLETSNMVLFHFCPYYSSYPLSVFSLDLPVQIGSFLYFPSRHIFLWTISSCALGNLADSCNYTRGMAFSGYKRIFDSWLGPRRGKRPRRWNIKY